MKKNNALFSILAILALCSCSSVQKAGYRGPSNDNSAAVEVRDVSGFSEIDQANYFAKNQQFDSAIVHYEYALTDKGWASKHDQEWNLGLRKLISIVIHIKRDPSLALEMVSRVAASGSVPIAYADEVRSWKAQFKAWRILKQPNPSTGSTQLASARSLSHVPVSGLNGLVSYMRASAYLNDYMKSADANSPEYTEALYMSGNIAEQLGLANLWTHSADFFSICAESKGNKAFSSRCKERLSTLHPSG